jgi:hypothetical protein
MSSRLGVVAWLITQDRKESDGCRDVFARQRVVARASQLLGEVLFGLFRFNAGLFVAATRCEKASGAHDVALSLQSARPQPSPRWSPVP